MPSPASWITQNTNQKAMCDHQVEAQALARLNDRDPLYRFNARFADTLEPVEVRRRNRIQSDSEGCRPASAIESSPGSSSSSSTATTTPEGKRSRDARFRRRQDARYRTQPVTFDEIKEIDELLTDDGSGSGAGGSGGGPVEPSQRQLRQQDSCPGSLLLTSQLAPAAIDGGGNQQQQQQQARSSGGKSRRDSE